MRGSFFLMGATMGLDNGYRVPPMGWSSWYGFTKNIDEVMLRQMGDGLISSGLQKAGYSHIWIDDGWAIARENTSGSCSATGPTGTDSCKPIVDPKLFPSGMRNLSDYLHQRNLKFGIYTSKGPLTCLGYQKTQPDRPGSCGYEQVDADTYANDWQVDQVKDDGCGGCPQHNPFVAMRDALNKTGRSIYYAIHSDGKPWEAGSDSNGSVANMWRTGDDLFQSSYDMWLDRLDLATDPRMAAFVGPGSFANPDFLEVGYSPRAPKGRTQSTLEQRSMFTMWAALPAPLILSADLRPNAACGGVDAEALETLTNTEVIAVNQDPLALPMRAVRRKDGVEVWKKPLTSEKIAVILFSRNASTTTPPTPAPGPQPLHPSLGAPVTIGAQACSRESSALPIDFVGGAMRVRSQDNLCLGSVGTCTCANPLSPKVGVVACNNSDPTQKWVYDLTNQQVNSGDTGHDLNAGPVCPGETDRNMLLYPTQGHTNEQYEYDAKTGFLFLKGDSSGACLSLSAKNPNQPTSRTIGVSWEELGLEADQKMQVRDLWAHKDLGVHSGNFSASVDMHEARIYVLVVPSTSKIQ